MGPRHPPARPRTGALRPGEMGVPVVKTLVPRPDGGTHFGIGIDFNKVPIPERRYAADVGAVKYDGTQVHVVFGQRRLVGGGLRSLIDIVMSPDAVRQFLESCDTFLPETRETFQRLGIVAVPLIDLGDELREEPQQTVAMSANIITVARAGRDATADVYHAPAASLHQLNHRDELALEPVVRVELPGGLLLALLDTLSRLASSGELPEGLST